jgi:hypothetical protein
MSGDITLEERFDRLERRFEALERRFVVFEEQMDRVLSLLLQIAERMGVYGERGAAQQC